MKEAIQKAIEGGYVVPTRVGNSDEFLMSINGKEPKRYTVLMGADFLLDPFFWQALGKTEGWSDYTEEHYTDRRDRTYSKTLVTWDQNWHEVAGALCGMDDGLPAQMDGATLSASAHRKARLKGLGNAIVPQVAMMIMESIKQTLDISQ